MIFVTGDTHREIDVKKLNTEHFQIQSELTKQDYVIICGDFGSIWDDSEKDFYWREWHNKKNYTTLFIDGNHENFDLLNRYPVTHWNGGKVHQIADSVYHLMRGQVFTIDGRKFFTMGGGTSTDRKYRIEGKTWWPEEEVSTAELEEARKNLASYNWEVDYILTHTTSTRIMYDQIMWLKENSELNFFLDTVQDKVNYKWWFFGHFHDDVVYDKVKCTLLCDTVRGLDNKIYTNES